MRVFTLLAFALGILACSGGAGGTDAGTVSKVVDGDTIDVTIGGREERVRLIGIDTPETHVVNGPPECYGPEASVFTASALPVGRAVRLERDVVGRDDYGRLLAYVYVDDERTGTATMINEAIVRNGFARPLHIAPNGTFADRFVAAAIVAEAEDLGLWGACGG